MEKIKRQDGNIASWVFLTLALIYNAFFIITCYNSKVIFGDVFMFSLFDVIILFFTVISIKSSEYIKTLRIEMYEFMFWDSDKAKYVKRYDFARTYLIANFILTFRLEDTIKTPTKTDIKNSIDNELEWSKTVGYETKEECMEDILITVKSILASKKIENNIKITDIEFTDSLDVEELIQKVLEENK